MSGARPLRALAPVVLAVLVAVTAPGCSDDGVSRGEDGRVTEAGDLSVFELQAGDCLVPPDRVDDELRTVRVVPCEQTHTQEVFFVDDLEDVEEYPGDEAVQALADSRCLGPFRDYVGIDYVDSSLFLTYLLPSVRSWDEGDREIVCIAQVLDASGMEGSVRDSLR